MKVEVSHHAYSDGKWSCTKPLVFVMDDPPSADVKKEKKKKKKSPPITQKNFGSYLDIEKVKSSLVLVLAWRCRLLVQLVYTFFLSRQFLSKFFFQP